MKYMDVYSELKERGIYVFSIDDLLKIFSSERDIVKQQIFYWKRKGWVRTLKKGIYEIDYPKRKELPDLFIANRLYEPSYVSLETALSHYSLIPEVAIGVTSVTTKPTREFRNHYGFFKYRTVVERAYCGYRLIDYRGQDVKIAEPEKAFVDYIYLNNGLNMDELRVNKRKLNELNKDRILGYAYVLNKTVVDVVEDVYANL
ncbi:MAG: hypothetical protein KJ928_05035 [Candidatus Altiarchaeota archaeon]|nr:hypothetical protein [Candidatus Altiarchaeota archaeon]